MNEGYGTNDNPVFYVESLHDKIQELEAKLEKARGALWFAHEFLIKDRPDAFATLRLGKYRDEIFDGDQSK